MPNIEPEDIASILGKVTDVTAELIANKYEELTGDELNDARYQSMYQSVANALHPVVAAL
jgi:hypothetical protein